MLKSQSATALAAHHPSKNQLKKRHWLLAGAVVMVGSWITHTTTATVYDDFNNREALAFARAMPDNGLALNGGLPDELFIQPLQLIHGPISNSTKINQSPADYVFGNAEPAFEETSYTITRGDTLGGIFKKLQLDLSLPYLISQDQQAKRLVRLSIGKKLLFKTDNEQQLRQIHYQLNPLQSLVVDIQASQIANVQVEDLLYDTQTRTVSAEITSSLYEAAIDAGLSISMVMEMVRVFGWDIDFVLDIRAGDNFHVIFDEHVSNGQKLADGNILAAEFTTQGETYRAFRFTNDDESVSYYNAAGESMLGTFLRSPVEFSRISSRFGRRKHPILKKWRAHKGVDYAAGRGTPIRATADGKVLLAGTKGGYGRTVVLRHAGRFSTLYGHMNGFAKGVRSGARVKQGDVIGYIGSSGLATGPHLHYEFRLDGVHRNPLTFKTPKASAVGVNQRAEFDQATQRWTAKLDTIVESYKLAKHEPEKARTSL